MALKGLTAKTQKKLEELIEPKKRPEIQPMNKEPQKPSGDYGKKRDKVLDEYLERKPFEFNINTDKLYSQYADQYKRQGEAAMRDTVAEAAAKTGGYASSYAVNAGAQAYGKYLDKLNEIVPTLEAAAYEKYSDELKTKKDSVDILDKLDGKEYDIYRDKVDDYKDERDYYRGIYEYENDAEYDMYKLLTDYILGIAKLENQDYKDERDRELAYAKLNI